MASKPNNLVVNTANNGSKNSSDASTPTEEYLTPSSDSVPLSGTSAFHFSDQSIKSVLQNASNKPSTSHGTFRISRTGSNVEAVIAATPTSTVNATKQPTRKKTQTINTNLQSQTSTAGHTMNQEDPEMLPTKETSNRHLYSKTEGNISVDNDLLTIRKKLEERRRKMEIDKRKMEQQWTIQKQAASKEAFSALFGSAEPNKFHPSDVTQSTRQPQSNTISNKKLSSSFSSSSGYYSQDSAIAMEKLFAHENTSNIKSNEQVKKSASEQDVQKSPQKVLPKSSNVRAPPTQQVHQHLPATVHKSSHVPTKPQKPTSTQQHSKQQPRPQHKPGMDTKKLPSHHHEQNKKPSDPKKNPDANYGSSLDRLNSSLSELQGEIMRLSLQQDHIKNLVTTNNINSIDAKVTEDGNLDQTFSPKKQYKFDDTASNYEHEVGHEDGPRLRHSYSNGTQVLPNNMNNPRRHSAFHRYSGHFFPQHQHHLQQHLNINNGGGGDDDIYNNNNVGGDVGDDPRLAYPPDPMMHLPQNANIPIPHLPIQHPPPAINPYMHHQYPYYPPPPPPPHMPPHPSMLNYYAYPVNPYYQTLNYSLNYNNPNVGIHKRGISPSFRSLDPRKDIPLRKDSSFGGLSDSQMRPHQGQYLGQKTRRESMSANRSSYATHDARRLSRPSSVMSDYFSGLNFLEKSNFDKDYQASPGSYPNYTYPQSHSSQQHARNSISSPGFYPSHTLQYSPSKDEASAMMMTTSMEDNDDDDIDIDQRKEEEPAKQCQQAEFFVVNLEAPKRPKPEIGLNRTKSKQVKLSGSQNASPDVVAIKADDVIIIPSDDGKLKNVQNSSSSLSKTDEDASETGSVGFIIDENELDSHEIEKAKNRLAELQQRRKEELKQKKNKISKDQVAKKEQQRLKEEKALQKKQEEKQRREAIFQQYLQRKTADLNDSNSTDDDIINNNNYSSSNNRPSPSNNVANKSGNNSSSKSSPISVASVSPSARPNKTRVSSATKQRPQSQLIVANNVTNNNSATFKKENVQDDSIIGSKQQQQQQMPYTADVMNIVDPFDASKKQERFSRFLSCGSDGGSEENYSGLKLFVKPNQKSNKSIIINAIKDCCLAGTVNHELKNKVIEEINKSDSKHFVVLFRDAGLQYRAVYSYNPDKQEVFKIHGVGPKQLVDKTMEKFFKYNSGAKNFSEVTSTKHLSSTIDGVTIPACMWTKKVTATTTTATATAAAAAAATTSNVTSGGAGSNSNNMSARR